MILGQTSRKQKTSPKRRCLMLTAALCLSLTISIISWRESGRRRLPQDKESPVDNIQERTSQVISSLSEVGNKNFKWTDNLVGQVHNFNAIAIDDDADKPQRIEIELKFNELKKMTVYHCSVGETDYICKFTLKDELELQLLSAGDSIPVHFVVPNVDDGGSIILIIMPIVKSLNDKLDNISKEDCLKHLKSCLHAVQRCHARGIFHYDAHLGNFFYKSEQDDTIFISDFDMSVDMRGMDMSQGQMRKITVGGNPKYLSWGPEYGGERNGETGEYIVVTGASPEARAKGIKEGLRVLKVGAEKVTEESDYEELLKSETTITVMAPAYRDYKRVFYSFGCFIQGLYSEEEFSKEQVLEEHKEYYEFLSLLGDNDKNIVRYARMLAEGVAFENVLDKARKAKV